MAYNELNTLIDTFINRNGVQAITGQILNGVLKAMVQQLGAGYSIGGVAEPSDDPGTPDAPVAYFASEPGTYTDFDGITIAPGEFALLCYDLNGGWSKSVMYEGFQSVGATVDGNTGTPAVNVTYNNGVLSFAFSNLKGAPGNDGNDGDAAGFGTIGATVDGNVGTPGVTVQESGPNTAKNLQFNFTNLKGETGVTSVVATVDDTVGTPTCTVSLVGQQLTLAFTGLKGAQGDTGSSVDYPFTIVNNLTTNDATQALSAAQGKVLKDELGQLEAEVDEKTTLFSPIVGTWRQGGVDVNNAFYPWEKRIIFAFASDKPIRIVVANGYYAAVSCYSVEYTDADQITTGSGYLGSASGTWVTGDNTIQPIAGCKTYTVIIKNGSAGTADMPISSASTAVTFLKELSPLNNAYVGIKKQVEGLQVGVVFPSYTLTSGYVATDGTMGTSNDYSYTSPFTLKKGQVVTVKTQGYLFSVIAKYGTTPLVPLVTIPTNPGSGVQVTYEYTATEDMQIVCTVKALSPYEIYIDGISKTIEKAVVGVAEDVNTLNEKVNVRTSGILKDADCTIHESKYVCGRNISSTYKLGDLYDSTTQDVFVFNVKGASSVNFIGEEYRTQPYSGYVFYDGKGNAISGASWTTTSAINPWRLIAKAVTVPVDAVTLAVTVHKIASDLFFAELVFPNPLETNVESLNSGVVRGGDVEAAYGSHRTKDDAYIAMRHSLAYDMPDENGNAYGFVFPVSEGTHFSIQCTWGAGMIAGVYNVAVPSFANLGSKYYIQGTYTTQKVTGTISQDGYLRVGIKKSDESAITDADITDIIAATTIELTNRGVYGDVLYGGVESSDIWTKNKDKLPILRGASNKGTRLTAMLVTDVHTDWKQMMDAVEFANKCEYINCVFFLGDYAELIPAETAYEKVQEAYAACEKPFFGLIGNHDSGYGISLQNIASLDVPTTELIAPVFANLEVGEYSVGVPYYYHDFTEHNIRGIFLCDFDLPVTLQNSDYWEAVTYDSTAPAYSNTTTYAQNDVVNFGLYTLNSFKSKVANNTGHPVKIQEGDAGFRRMTQTQLEWLVSTLLSTPQDYKVFICNHIPASNGYDEYVRTNKFCSKRLSEGLFMNPFSADYLGAIVDAFNNGTSGTINVSYKNVSYDGHTYRFDMIPSFNLSYDFTGKNSGAMAMCFVSGHTHIDFVTKNAYDLYTVISKFTDHTTRQFSYDDVPTSSDDFDIARDALTVISFDTENNAVILTRVGTTATTDGYLRDTDCIDL